MESESYPPDPNPLPSGHFQRKVTLEHSPIKGAKTQVDYFYDEQERAYLPVGPLPEVSLPFPRKMIPLQGGQMKLVD
jgi:hypothetical protein